MAPVIPIRRTLDPVLADFFRGQRGRTAGRRRERVERAEAALRACFEDAASWVLTEPEEHLLQAEEQVDPREGAAARVAGPDALLLVLPEFLDGPRWHGEDREDRRLRTHLALAAARHVARLPELAYLSVGCEVWSVEHAVERALTALRTSRPARDVAAP